MARFFLLSIILLLGNTLGFSQSTFDVQHYDITVDTIDFGNKTINAHVGVRVEAVGGAANSIQLSLLRFQIDSIKQGSQSLSYNYNDTTVDITLAQSLNSGDSTEVMIYYQGHPQEDNSGFGGFYFQGSTYAFNIGVGFEANPHNYGRVWFPCVDNFTDRATYTFHIRALDTYKAFCNGELTGIDDNGDGTFTHHWDMPYSIPSYLASMAVAPFYSIERNYHNIPVNIAVLPNDSNNTINTFQNLESCIGTFLNSYGPYQWNKIGYVSVPFNAGAMEHSTSIHIGKAFINGSLTYETLWAHELAHQWWGDLVTCERKEEMWLNEGFAAYSEAVFLEGKYGRERYKNYVRSNHRKVLQFAHIIDDGYRPLNNIPHEYTYSTTVYDKGADIAHTLRGYMGDSAFFNGCKHYFNTMAYQSASSEDLRNALSTTTTANMDQFFLDWVFTGGFPHFSVDSFTVASASGGTFDVTIHTRQKQKGNNHNYIMPLQFTFRDGTNEATETFTINNTTNTFQTNLNFSPTMVTIDKEELVSDAITDYELKLFTMGNVDFKETNASINVTNGGSDSSLVRIEHNWVAPDGFINPPADVQLSDYHYYTVDGIFSPGFQASATLIFNGMNNQNVGYLDNNLITGSEDSLLLFYREGAGYEWELVQGYTIDNQGSHNDKRGRFQVNTLKKGQYAYGYRDTGSSVKTGKVKKNDRLVVFPNPSHNSCTIQFDLDGLQKADLKIYTSSGKLVHTQAIKAGEKQFTWNHSGLAAGTYTVSLEGKSGPIGSAQVIVE